MVLLEIHSIQQSVTNQSKLDDDELRHQVLNERLFRTIRYEIVDHELEHYGCQ